MRRPSRIGELLREIAKKMIEERPVPDHPILAYIKKELRTKPVTANSISKLLYILIIIIPLPSPFLEKIRKFKELVQFAKIHGYTITDSGGYFILWKDGNVIHFNPSIQ